MPNKAKITKMEKLFRALDETRSLNPTDEECDEFRRRPDWPEVTVTSSIEYCPPNSVVIETKVGDTWLMLYKIEKAFIKFIKEKRGIPKRKSARRTVQNQIE
jgi:hypothetical protein